MNKYNFAEYVTARDVKVCRKKMNMTQKEFADLLGISKPTVERMENAKKNITGPIAVLIDMLLRDETLLADRKIPEKECPLRLYYMHRSTICTIIDVNETTQYIKIKNYAKNINYRAFGVNDHPTYQDYQDFLRSRCFPESRDKIKVELDALGIPFYDPMLIIEKTEGRMAEDDFWIKLER